MRASSHSATVAATAGPRVPMGTAAAFVVICVTWGLSWTAVKVAVAVVPPLLFAGTRFVAAGLALLAIAALWEAGFRRPARADLWRFVASGALMTALNAGPMFWGMLYVPSGLAGVVNLALIPASLYAFALIHRAETFRLGHVTALALGAVGLVLLFSPDAVGSDPLAAFGLAMIVAGTLAYSWGAILCRPLVSGYGPIGASGVICTIGGILMLPVSIAVERPDMATLAGFARPEVLAAWLFMAIMSSVVAMTLYLRIQRDWGPARAGLYAFVSPVIAVVVGVVWHGETLTPTAIAGMAILGASAWLAMRPQAS